MYTRITFSGIGICIGVMLAISSCTLTATRPADVGVDKVWPGKPAQARIAYIKSFSNSQDLGVSRGFFQSFLDFFTGQTESHLVRPMAILSATDGTLYVADPGSKGVHHFDTVKGKHRIIRGHKDTSLLSPVGLAEGARGEIYVADSSSGRILIIRPGADIAEPMVLKVNPSQPTGIAVDQTSGRLYVVDTASHHIKIYTHDGTLVKTFGQRGNGNGEFNFPTMIWHDKTGRLLITDALNFRIQIFDAEGNYIRQFGRPGDGTGNMARPKGVAVDQYGHIYVVDALFHSVQVFSAKGAFLLNFGLQGQGVGEFWLPTGIFISKNNIIYVADSHNKRIQVFRYIGERP